MVYICQSQQTNNIGQTATFSSPFFYLYTFYAVSKLFRHWRCNILCKIFIPREMETLHEITLKDVNFDDNIFFFFLIFLFVFLFNLSRLLLQLLPLKFIRFFLNSSFFLLLSTTRRCYFNVKNYYFLFWFWFFNDIPISCLV